MDEPNDPANTATFRPAAIIGERMVLQRHQPIRFWGRGLAGAIVKAEFAGCTAQGAVDAHGRWAIELPAMAAGGPHHLSLSLLEHAESAEPIEQLTFEDVLIGEVWLISGQSNAFMLLKSVEGAGDVLEQAELPAVRLNHDRGWEHCTPDSAEHFSAIGWYFGQRLREQLPDVPIGLIQRARGGTAIHSWITPQTFRADESLRRRVWEPWHHYAELRPYLRDALAATEPEARPLSPQKLETLQQHGPSVDFRQRIEPLVPYALAGIVWYQGESNAWGFAAADEYEAQLQALIADWRRLWDRPGLPVILAQLPNYTAEPGPEPAEPDPWALVQRAQADVARRTPHCRIAVALDTGGKDIHPRRKRQLGRRLAASALAEVYGRDAPHVGPTCREVRREGEALRACFDHAPGLRPVWKLPDPQRSIEELPPEAPHLGFAIAGEDRAFHWAEEARVEGQTVLLRSRAVPEPVAVRYAHWQAAPWSLVNEHGLPAGPFRSDDWHWDLLADLPADAWPKHAAAERWATPPSIDPEAPIWRRLSDHADPFLIAGFTRRHTLAAAPAPTRAILGWDETALYAAVHCANPPGHRCRSVTDSDKPEALFGGDYLELLVDAEGKGETYHRLAVNPEGGRYASEAFVGRSIGRLPLLMSALSTARRNSPDWPGQAMVVTDVAQDGGKDGAQWRGVLTIPWAALDLKEPPQAQIGLQFVRGFGNPAAAYEWTPTGRDRSTGAMMPPPLMNGLILFQSPDRFGRLRLTR